MVSSFKYIKLNLVQCLHAYQRAVCHLSPSVTTDALDKSCRSIWWCRARGALKMDKRGSMYSLWKAPC